MSFQNLILPDLVISELYKNVHLNNVENLNQKTLKLPQAESVSLKFLGNNAKRVTIIVKHVNETFLPEKHLEFLIKILSACKLNIGDVAIINQANRPANINQLLQQLHPKQLIMFGIEPTEIKLPMSFPNFKLQLYADTTYLSVPSLDLLNSETEDGKLLKTKLWVCLKAMFDVSGSKL